MTSRLENPDVDLGKSILERVFVSKWMHRRVDTFRFIGTSGIRQSISFDVEVSPSANTLFTNALGRQERILPLMYVRKSNTVDDMEMLRDLNLRDERNAALPALGRHENSLVAWSMLAVATQRLNPNQVISPQALDLLWSIVSEPGATAAAIRDQTLSKATSTHPATWDPLFAPVFKALQNQGYTFIFKKLATSYLFCTALPEDGVQACRRVIKLSCEADFSLARVKDLQEAYEEKSARLLALTGRLGFREIPVRLFIREPLPTLSLHAAVEDPGELFEAELWQRGLSQTTFSFLRRDDKLKNKRFAHLHAGEIGPDREVEIVARLARSFGSLTPAIAVLAVLTAVLAIFASIPANVVTGLDASVALLVIVPGVAAGVLAARREHQFTSKVMRPLRVSLGLAFVVAILAGVVVVALPSHSSNGTVNLHGLDVWLYILSGVAALLTLLVAVASGARTRARHRLRKEHAAP